MESSDIYCGSYIGLIIDQAYVKFFIAFYDKVKQNWNFYDQGHVPCAPI
jgi:hypothetical protein